MISKKEKNVTIILMIVLGACMHFVLDVLPSGPISVFLGNIFPVNETTWEHMKMIWYPFLVAGIILSFRVKNSGYFASFVVSAINAMLMMIGAFAIYQSFSGISILVMDIIIYTVGMFFSIVLAFELTQKNWSQKLFPLWVVLAVIITVGIIWLTYNPGEGYVFLDNEGFIE